MKYMALLVIAGLAIVLLYFFARGNEEAFQVPDCGSIRDCVTCANTATCGFCNERGTCIQLDRNGMPPNFTCSQDNILASPEKCPGYVPQASLFFSEEASEPKAYSVITAPGIARPVNASSIPILAAHEDVVVNIERFENRQGLEEMEEITNASAYLHREFKKVFG